MSAVISSTFKRGDKHPTNAELFFWGLDRRFNPPEKWVTKESLAVRRKSKYLNRKKHFLRGYRNPGLKTPETKKRRSQQSRAWQKNNPEKMAAKGKKWRENNAGYVKMKAQETRAKNKDRIRAAIKRWREANRHWYLHANAVRREKIKSSRTPSDTTAILLVYKFCRILNVIHRKWAPKGVFHVDHIKPLAKGGLHCSANLRITTAAYNLSKHTGSGQRLSSRKEGFSLNF